MASKTAPWPCWLLRPCMPARSVIVEPGRSGLVVAAQAVDHRDGRGGRDRVRTTVGRPACSHASRKRTLLAEHRVGVARERVRDQQPATWRGGRPRPAAAGPASWLPHRRAAGSSPVPTAVAAAMARASISSCVPGGVARYRASGRRSGRRAAAAAAKRLTGPALGAGERVEGGGLVPPGRPRARASSTARSGARDGVSARSLSGLPWTAPNASATTAASASATAASAAGSSSPVSSRAAVEQARSPRPREGQAARTCWRSGTRRWRRPPGRGRPRRSSPARRAASRGGPVQAVHVVAVHPAPGHSRGLPGAPGGTAAGSSRPGPPPARIVAGTRRAGYG